MSEEEFDLKAKDRGYYRVYRNDKQHQISKHLTEREASQEGINAKKKTPHDKIFYTHDYRVDVMSIKLSGNGETGLATLLPIIALESIDPITVGEGDGDIEIGYTISEEPGPDGILLYYQLNYATASNLDIGPATGSVNIPQGAPLEGVITLNVVDDLLAEGTENCVIEFISANNAVVAPDSAKTIYIQDNEGEVLAFPGAMGFGARVTGGRGGQVIKVTNGNSSGAGSLQAALDVVGPRIITFDYSGVIDTDGPRHELVVEEGDVTIAGQTAPGAGITINGRLVGKYDYSVKNIIARHLRIRPPVLDNTMIAGNQWDSVQFSRNSDVILDHLSIAGGVDELLDIYEAQNITIQSCSIEDALSSSLHPDGANHYYGAIAGPSASHISFIENLFANVKRRAPAIANGPSETINNVMYNTQASWQFQNPATGKHIAEGNYFKDGPDETLVPFYLDAESVNSSLELFFDNNYVDDPGEHVGLFDVWGDGEDHSSTAISNLCGAFSGGNCASYKVNVKPQLSGAYYKAPTPINPVTAYTNILDNVGAFPRDIVSSNVIGNVTGRTGNGGGNYTYPSDPLVGLTVGSAPVDTNNDGVPDDWSTANGYDPAGPNIAQDIMANGYPAVENYINELSDTIINGEVISGPGEISIAVNSASYSESEGTIEVTLVRNNGSTGAASVRVNTVNGTAIGGTHFTAISDEIVNFADGQLSETVDLTLIDNVTEDGNVAAQLSLDNPTGATLGPVVVLDFTIIDDEGYTPPLMDNQLKNALNGYGTSNPQYVEYLNEIENYIVNNATNSNDRNFFNYGGCINPIVVFGPNGVPAGWEAGAKQYLSTELQNFPVTNRNTIRLSGGDLFLACIALRDHYPAFYSTSEWNNIVYPSLEAIADHLYTTHEVGGVAVGDFYESDSDESNSWVEIAYYASLILPDGSVKNRMAEMFPNLLDWFKNRIILPDGTFSRGCGIESTTYMGHNGRYPSRILYILNKAGFNINAGDWHDGYALHNALLWLSDESGIWGYHDGDGIQTQRDGVYPADWQKAMKPNSERTGRWTDSPLLNSKGSPQHEALCYFMDNVIPANHASGRNSKDANWLFRDDQAGPSDLTSIAGLPTSYNPGKRSIYAARKDWSTGAVQFFYNKTQFRQQDHCPAETSIEIWDDGRPVMHDSTMTSTSNKTNPVSTMYIESFGGATGKPEYFPFDTYPGCQGARSIQYGSVEHGDFIPHGPKDILDFSDSVAANVVTENGQRYWDDSTASKLTKFLKTWNRTVRVDWDGLAFIFDYISMDVADFQDLITRYTNYPEAGRDVSKAYFNRRAMRLTRMTAYPTLNNGWYGWSEHGLQSYFKEVSHQAKTMRVVNEKTEQPWAGWDHYKQWPVQKVAHLQESLELTNTSGFDNMDFVGLLAWGEGGEAQPVSFKANDPVAGSNHYGAAALHKGTKKIFMTTRDPLVKIGTTVELTFPGLAPGAGSKFAGINFDPAEKFSISVSSDTVTITNDSSGTSPNSDGILELTV